MVPSSTASLALLLATERPGDCKEHATALLRLVAQGETNRGIGQAIGLSLDTVHHHLTRLIRHLGVRNRAQLAGWAGHKGCYDEPDRSTAPGQQLTLPNSRSAQARRAASVGAATRGQDWPRNGPGLAAK